MTTNNISEAQTVIRRSTEEVQGGGISVFEELFADDFLDHRSRDARPTGVRGSSEILRAAFPGFHPTSIGSLPMATRDDVQNLSRDARGEFFSVAPTVRLIRDRRCHARTRRQNHRALGVANLFRFCSNWARGPRRLAPNPFRHSITTLKGTFHVIGIIGSGAIGTAFARTRRAHRGDYLQQPRSGAERTGAQLGPIVKAGTRARKPHADIVFVAVNWTTARSADGTAGVVRPHSHRRQ
jgi:hypothetical protein